jgi:hypothetical protein
VLSAGASPSTSSPTGNYAVSKITVAQIYVLLSTIKAKKDDPVEWENKVIRLNKVRDRHHPQASTHYHYRRLGCRLLPSTSLFSIAVLLLPCSSRAPPVSPPAIPLHLEVCSIER